MALKSMVVVQHRKIIPFRRRVSANTSILIYYNCATAVSRLLHVKMVLSYIVRICKNALLLLFKGTQVLIVGVSNSKNFSFYLGP